METTLAILMVLGIFVGIPALIGFAIAGTYLLRDQRVCQVETVPQAHAEAVAKEVTKKHVAVA